MVECLADIYYGVDWRSFAQRYPELNYIFSLIIGYNQSNEHGLIDLVYQDRGARELIARHSFSALHRLPYKLLSYRFRSFLDGLSMRYGYQVFNCYISNASMPQVYEGKRWVPHGSHQSCVYTIRQKSRTDNESSLMFIFYGTMGTISLVVAKSFTRIGDPKISIEFDRDLSVIYGGLDHKDIALRCEEIYRHILCQAKTSPTPMSDNLSLAALKEPNYGHHRWNIASAYLDIMDYVSSPIGIKTVASIPRLAYDPDTNYLSLDKLADFFKAPHCSIREYSHASSGYIIPLDSPRSRDNELPLLSEAFRLPIYQPKASKRKAVIVAIKGFSESNQNQLESTLAASIYESVVRCLLSNNFIVYVDGVNRSASSGTADICRNETFQLFLHRELRTYRSVLSRINPEHLGRIFPLMGKTVERKSGMYRSADFTISISAHSTIATSRLLGLKTVDIIDSKILKSSLSDSKAFYQKGRDLSRSGFIAIDPSWDLEKIIETVTKKLGEFIDSQEKFMERYSLLALSKQEFIK